GMFMFRASVFLAEMKKHRSDILSACSIALADSDADNYILHVSAEKLALCADESVDYALMEHTDLGLVVSLDAGWNDL
ncbi:mannose-1-phosphate guanylyltransferase/mannose-6-phosphate isomerase, partial [Pseudomonas syringae pv. tagetis]